MIAFLREVFCEPHPSGKWSFARISSAIWLSGCIAWISVMIAIRHNVPDGQVFFGMAAVVTALYGVNKVASKWFGDSDDK